MPNDVQSAFGEAVRLHQGGQLGAAEIAYQQVLGADPGNANALHLLGVLMMQSGRYHEGVARIEKAIALTASAPVPEFYGNLAAGLRAIGQLDRAAAHLKTVVTLKPADAAAHFRAGLVLMEAGKYEEAAAYFNNAIAIKADFAEAHSNLGMACRHLGNLEKAERAFRQALKFQSKEAAAHYSLGVVLKDMGRIEEAANCFRAAVDLDPQHAGAQWNLALANLLLGDFDAGWRTFAWYAKARGEAPPAFSQPAWDGSDITGKTILLYEEHGYGDTLQFVRYATEIRKRAARVIVRCRPELVRLMSTVPGVDAVVQAGASLPPFDCHAPLFMLPKLLTTRIDTIPNTVPYFFPASSSGEAWRARGVLKPGRNAGVVWRGNVKTDPRRAIPLEQIAKVWAVSGFHWLSLQLGTEADERAALFAGDVQECGELLSDWEDTAALISALDLVVTIDTGVAHLAGALGKPVWILLPFVPDWRWLRERRDSPWYPTAKLFRQASRNGWEHVMDEVVESLRAL